MLNTLYMYQEQVIKEQSSHDEHASASSALLLSQQSDSSEASTKGTAAVKNVDKNSEGKGKAAGAKDRGSVSASNVSQKSDEHHDVDSGVKSRVASLAHASEHLKEATIMLEKKLKEGGNASVANGTAVVTNGASGNNSSASAKTVTTADVKAAPDLLAYSKEKNQPGDSIHVLFTSNGIMQ